MYHDIRNIVQNGVFEWAVAVTAIALRHCLYLGDVQSITS